LPFTLFSHGQSIAATPVTAVVRPQRGDVTGWARKTLDARFEWLSQQTGDALAWVNERSTEAEAAQALVS